MRPGTTTPRWRRAISRAGLAVHLAASDLRARAAALRARAIRRRNRRPSDDIRVVYGHLGFPASPREAPPAGGGGIKYLWLEDRFPHSFPECDIVYVVSSSCHPRVAALLDAAKSRGIPIVWNQNGAYFPHSYGRDAAASGNARLVDYMRRADYVFYQSEFAKSASDHFMGPCACGWEILYNAVDVARYSAVTRVNKRPLTLLAAGSHDDPYRIPLLLDTFALVRKSIPDARLVVAGRIAERDREALDSRLGREPWADAVECTGPYRSVDAPSVFSKGDIFLHVKYCDVCPSVVLEAMASGLPVVCSATGGTPELVGEAGIGIPGRVNWDAFEPPSAAALAQAVLDIAGDLDRYAAQARVRAAARFDLVPWLDRHEAVFRKLLERASR